MRETLVRHKILFRGSFIYLSPAHTYLLVPSEQTVYVPDRKLNCISQLLSCKVKFTTVHFIKLFFESSWEVNQKDIFTFRSEGIKITK